MVGPGADAFSTHSSPYSNCLIIGEPQTERPVPGVGYLCGIEGIEGKWTGNAASLALRLHLPRMRVHSVLPPLPWVVPVSGLPPSDQPHRRHHLPGNELPLTVWFQALHLLTQGKHGASALELKRQLGVCYETAWNLKQKIMQLMLEREESTVLSGRIEADDAYAGGEHHEGKRGRGAAGKAPFVAAVQTDPANPASVLRMRMKALKHVAATDLKSWFATGFAKGSMILTDGWKAHRFLEEPGFGHESHTCRADGARRSTLPPFG